MDRTHGEIMQINTRLSMKEAAHRRTVHNKPMRLAKWLPVINHPYFDETLTQLRPMAQMVIKLYLQPQETYPKIADEMNITTSEAERYFREGMGKMKKLLEV